MSRYKLFATCGALLLVGLTACKKDNYNLPSRPTTDYTKVYMPQAVNNPQSYLLKISDTAQEMVYSANYGAPGYPNADIAVSFSVDQAVLDSFNTANHTSYPILPAKAYSLSASSATIKKGTLGTGPLTISVNTSTGANSAMDILRDYMLPVTMTTIDSLANVNLRTTFYKVRAQPDLKDYPAYDRSAWAILGFSSQEANGEGPNNGRAIFTLDGDPNTYWHTQWQGGSPGPPHWLVIDLGATKTIHGLSLLPRQGDQSGKPQNVSVQVSNDNVTWTPIGGTLTFDNNKSLQSQFVSPFTDARYFKLVIETSYNASYTHLAELNVF